MTSTSLTPSAWPIDATEDKPQGAAGLTYAQNLAGRDDVQSWHRGTAEWLDGSNAAQWGGDELVWWREKPQPSDAITDAADWIDAVCRSAQGFQTVRLDEATLRHGAELIEGLRAIAEQDGR